ncbi:MAG TPA: DUF3775 domain-containing protein [Rhizomicrobium sp.]|nr:DUF3775 domain-containing protein [Rhizomicrobium sp.]
MPVVPNQQAESLPELGISPEKVRYVIFKARQYDGKEADSDPDEGSNAADDDMVDVMEDKPQEDAVREELIAFINGLDEDEQINLVALAWLGRGTFSLDEWGEAMRTARDEHNNRTAQYLLGLPLLGDYLAEGLDAFGESVDDETEAEFEAEPRSEEDDS